jgi:hypothetical protein
MQVTPHENFTDPDLRSEYLVGPSYTVKDYVDPTTGKLVKAEDSLLAKKLPGWIEEGKVRLGGPSITDAATLAGESVMSGSGTVE